MPKDKIDDLLEQREQVYGDKITTHARIAEVWSGICGHPINGQQVALMMAGLKLVRASISPDYSDSYDDIQGYTRIAQEISEA